jgi:uncharacterized protein YecE (DUF72 family)
MTESIDILNRVEPGRVLVGCAGWCIPKSDVAAFPEQGSHLERYAAVLGAVEINSSFYRPHQIKTYVRWSESVPDDFRFSVKLPRTITHDAKLVGIDEALTQFAREVAGLGHKLGCVLVQLPPKLGFDEEVAQAFFSQVQASLGCTIACEARHPEWFSAAATEVLMAHGVTRVIADPAKGQEGPHVPTASTIYVRLHGSPRIYYSSYEPHYLAQLARDIADHAAAGRTVWTIFDNTASGAAVLNALAIVPRCI